MFDELYFAWALDREWEIIVAHLARMSEAQREAEITDLERQWNCSDG